MTDRIKPTREDFLDLMTKSQRVAIASLKSQAAKAAVQAALSAQQTCLKMLAERYDFDPTLNYTLDEVTYELVVVPQQ